jgi:O-antigen/teichoic acid export membrane protein
MGTARTATRAAGKLPRLAAPLRRSPLQALTDQALSSLTNFGTSLVAARLAGPERFGTIAIALSVAYTTMMVGRALVGEPLLATLANTTEANRRDAERGALMTAFLIGTLVAIPVGVASALPWIALRDCWLVAFWLPSLLVQDSSRYAGFSRLRPAISLGCDAAWAVIQFGLVAILFATGTASGPGIVVAWGAGATAGAVVGIRVFGISAAGSTLRWLRRTRRYSLWLVPQLTLGQFTSQVTAFLIAGLFGTAALGGMRAMLTLSMPVFVLLTAAQALAVPTLTRLLETAGQAQFIIRVHRWAIGITSAGVVIALTAVILANPLTRLLFGDRYLSYSSFILPFAVGAVLHASALLPASGLRALQDSRSMFVVQVIVSVTTIGAVLIAALLFTPYISVWAMTSQGLCSAILSWVAFKRSCRRSVSASASMSRRRGLHRIPRDGLAGQTGG